MKGVEREGGTQTMAELSNKRDALIAGLLQATKSLRKL